MGPKLEFFKKLYISLLSDTRLLSEIGFKGHIFYSGTEDEYTINFLKSLIEEAHRRNLSNSKNVVWAESVLKGEHLIQKPKHKNEDIDYKSLEKFFELTKKRQSIRKFTSQKIPSELIKKILACAVESPSSCNRQSWRFLVVTDEESKLFLSKIRNIPFIKDAPALICVLINKEVYTSELELRYTPYLDGGSTIMTILYAATSSGLSACWINFGEKEISKKNLAKFKEYFKLNKNLLPISLVVLGFSDQQVLKPKREPLEYYCLNEF